MSDSSESVKTAGSRNGDHVTVRRTRKVRVSSERHDLSLGCRNNFKIPQFSADDPEIWFALLESQFYNYNITDDHIKYTYVITNLDMSIAKTVKEIIINPPAENKYNKIKTELILRLTASQEKKIRQLLMHEELGDRKPSQFLRHLQDLAGPSVPEDFITTIWCDRLPEKIQTVLASQTTHTTE